MICAQFLQAIFAKRRKWLSRKSLRKWENEKFCFRYSYCRTLPDAAVMFSSSSFYWQPVGLHTLYFMTKIDYFITIFSRYHIRNLLMFSNDFLFFCLQPDLLNFIQVTIANTAVCNTTLHDYSSNYDVSDHCVMSLSFIVFKSLWQSLQRSLAHSFVSCFCVARSKQ